MAKGKEVVTKKPAGLPMSMDKELAADAGAGFEEASRDAFAIPFLTILQDLSPQTKSKMPGYIPGAKPGQFFQTVSQKRYDKIQIIPCHFSQVFIEWIPRDKGGGFVAALPPNSPRIQEATREGSKMLLPNGNELMDTRQHFVLLVESDGTSEGVLIALKSTGLKISRRWMSQMKSAVITVGDRIIAPPMFAFQYTFGSEEEGNDQGQWHQWSILDRTRVENLELYRKAKAFGAAMKTGGAKVNYEELRTHDSGGTPKDLDNNEIPG